MRLTLEPWAPEYDTAQQTSAGYTPLELKDIRLDVELETWNAVQPSRSRIEVGQVFFIDGRRRLEAKVFAEWRDEQNHPHSAPGLLGTFAVGLAELNLHGDKPTSRLLTNEHTASRVLILGGAHTVPDVVIPKSLSKLGELRYRCVSLPDETNEENMLEHGLQRLMRRSEAETVRNLNIQNGLLIVDGPLEHAKRNAIGYIKTLHDLRLPASHQRTMFELELGQRTPVFSRGGKFDRFSWFVRIGQRVDWHQGLSGVVRLEVQAENGLEWAKAVADWSCLVLPKFAAKGYRDPRAPQQLMPVVFLEQDLGRRMGDITIIRRRIYEYMRYAWSGANISAISEVLGGI